MSKTLSFAGVHFTVAFLVGYLMTGSIWVGGALALVEPACNTVAFRRGFAFFAAGSYRRRASQFFVQDFARSVIAVFFTITPPERRHPCTHQYTNVLTSPVYGVIL